MNRRGFLSLLGVGLGIAAVPDPLRRYFFAPSSGWGPVDWKPPHSPVIYTFGDPVAAELERVRHSLSQLFTREEQARLAAFELWPSFRVIERAPHDALLARQIEAIGNFAWPA